MLDIERPNTELHPSPARIIQGGMGIAVSSWRLARAVAQHGGYGVVSGTGIDTVMVRELQDGDPFGRIRALRAYPDPEIATFIIDQYYVPGGIGTEKPYKLLPMHKFKPTVRSQRILSAAAFTEVFLAREGHGGRIGMNLLCELKRYSLACMYGAMLAGVDGIFMGAGIPKEEAEQIPNLASGKPGRLRLEVDTSRAPNPDEVYYYELNPSDLLEAPPQMPWPEFYPIISSDMLARILAKKLPEGLITGWVVEGAIAGGHNAPPRNKKYDENQNPVYDERDIPNLNVLADLGYPFYLAGGYASPERFQEALELGAAGIQVGSLFSLTEESGYPAAYKRELITAIHRNEVTVRTDGRISPTGYPFKVVELEGTLGIPENYAKRQRHCDLGYLQQAYVDEKGRMGVRCPAEPVDVYVEKGGKLEDTERRGCLCNGLMSNIGLAQRQKWGTEERLFTGGDEIVYLPLASAEHPSYSAHDVIQYLCGTSASAEAPVQQEALQSV